MRNLQADTASWCAPPLREAGIAAEEVQLAGFCEAASNKDLRPKRLRWDPPSSSGDWIASLRQEKNLGAGLRMVLRNFDCPLAGIAFDVTGPIPELRLQFEAPDIAGNGSSTSSRCGVASRQRSRCAAALTLPLRRSNQNDSRPCPLTRWVCEVSASTSLCADARFDVDSSPTVAPTPQPPTTTMPGSDIEPEDEGDPSDEPGVPLDLAPVVTAASQGVSLRRIRLRDAECLGLPDEVLWLRADSGLPVPPREYDVISAFRRLLGSEREGRPNPPAHADSVVADNACIHDCLGWAGRNCPARKAEHGWDTADLGAQVGLFRGAAESTSSAFITALTPPAATVELLQAKEPASGVLRIFLELSVFACALLGLCLGHFCLRWAQRQMARRNAESPCVRSLKEVKLVYHEACEPAE
eukprot:TRINITY_DN11806_c0_g3_i1.p1 TRINITY_DN11806_c0_g3~~TRINITY_DN11806_c0_g3_i1.p1  ORF type:complete len:465 (+),score=81.17 TRINITY_DN11806_c0_g3_i1:157-1395(+)